MVVGRLITESGNLVFQFGELLPDLLILLLLVAVMPEEEAGDHTTQSAKQTNPGDHQHPCNQSTLMGYRVFITVTHCRDGGDAPPDGIVSRADIRIRCPLGEENHDRRKRDD